MNLNQIGTNVRTFARQNSETIMFVLLICIAVCALLPCIASADAKTITDGVGDGSKGIYDLIKEIVKPVSVVVLSIIAFFLLFNIKDPRAVAMSLKAAGITVAIVIAVYFAPAIIEWIINLLEDAGGGKWVSF